VHGVIASVPVGRLNRVVVRRNAHHRRHL